MTVYFLDACYRYFFLCGRWLAVDEDDGMINRVLAVAGDEEIKGFNHLFFTTTRQNISDEHIWLSVVARPTKSNFTRCQRLTCCLTLLFSTMIASAMWYRSEETTVGDQAIILGPLIFSLGTLYISVMANLTVIPINIIIVQLFRKSRAKPPAKSKEAETQEKYEDSESDKDPEPEVKISKKDVGDVLFSNDKAMLTSKAPEKKTKLQDTLQMILTARKINVDVEDPEDAGPTTSATAAKRPAYYAHTNILRDEVKQEQMANDEEIDEVEEEAEKNKKWWRQKYPLPYWCSYIAWVLAVLTMAASAFFVVLYSLEWGKTKSEAWLSSLFLSFFQSVIIMQPVKVIFSKNMFKHLKVPIPYI